MEELSDKLGAILNDPQAMQSILSMAQSLGASLPSADAASQDSVPSMPDPAMLRAISGLAAGSGIDDRQQSLLNALRPYLSSQRLEKLEKAMRATKMARMASVFFNSGGIQLLSGR